MTRCVTTLEVIKDYFMYRLNEIVGRTDATLEADENKFVSSEALEMIRKLVLEAEHKNHECYDLYINESKCKLPQDTYEIIKNLQEIAEKLFSDKCINWGRLISLISFIGYYTFSYACNVPDINTASTFACKMIEWLTSFITCKAGMWIECNGGWELFVKCREQESSGVTKYWWGK